MTELKHITDFDSPLGGKNKNDKPAKQLEGKLKINPTIPEDEKLKQKMIEGILNMAGLLTWQQTKMEKVKFMQKKLKINSLKDLKIMSCDKLDMLRRRLIAIEHREIVQHHSVVVGRKEHDMSAVNLAPKDYKPSFKFDKNAVKASAKRIANVLKNGGILYRHHPAYGNPVLAHPEADLENNPDSENKKGEYAGINPDKGPPEVELGNGVKYGRPGESHD